MIWPHRQFNTTYADNDGYTATGTRGDWYDDTGTTSGTTSCIILNSTYYRDFLVYRRTKVKKPAIAQDACLPELIVLPQQYKTVVPVTRKMMFSKSGKLPKRILSRRKNRQYKRI